MEREQSNQSEAGTTESCKVSGIRLNRDRHPDPKTRSAVRIDARKWRRTLLSASLFSLCVVHPVISVDAYAKSAPYAGQIPSVLQPAENIEKTAPMTLAQAASSTTTSTVTTSSSSEHSLLMVRTQELIDADHREIDSMAARIKEMIKARYRADVLRIEAQKTIEQLRLRIAELEKRLSDANVDHQEMMAQRDALQQQLELRTAERNNARDDINVLAGEIDSQREVIDALRADAASAADDLAARQQQIIELTDELNSHRDSGDVLQSSLSATEDKLKDKGRQLGLAEERLVDARQQLADLRGQLAELKTERNKTIADLKADRSNALEEIASLKQRRDAADQRANSLLSEKENLNGKLGLFQSRSNDVSNALVAEQKKHAQARENVAALEDSVADLQVDIETATKQRDALLAQKSRLEGDNEKLLGSLTNANDKLKITKKELERRQAGLQTAKNQHVDTTGKLQAARDELEDLHSQLASAHNEIGKLNAHIGTLDKQVAGLVANRDKSQKSINGLKVSESTLQQQLDKTKKHAAAQLVMAQNNLNKQKESLQTQIDRRDKDLLQLNGRVSELTADLDELQTDSASVLQGRDTRISALEAQLAELESTKTELLVEGERATETMGNLHNLIASLEQQEKESNEKLQQLQDKYAALESNGQKNAEGLQQRLAQTEEKLQVTTNELNALLQEKSTLKAERDAVLSEAEKLRISLTDQLRAAKLETVTVQKARADNSIPLRLGNADFFAPGSAKLTAGGGEKLKKLAEIISSFPDRRIVVEGHTDNVQIGYRLRSMYFSNWELSVARAAAAVRHMQYESNIDPHQLSAVGYGEYAPVASNETIEGRQLNRRVEVVLYPRQDKEVQFSAIED